MATQAGKMALSCPLGQGKSAVSVSVHKHYKKERGQYPAILDLTLGE